MLHKTCISCQPRGGTCPPTFYLFSYAIFPTPIKLRERGIGILHIFERIRDWERLWVWSGKKINIVILKSRRGNLRPERALIKNKKLCWTHDESINFFTKKCDVEKLKYFFLFFSFLYLRSYNPTYSEQSFMRITIKREFVITIFFSRLVNWVLSRLRNILYISHARC